MIVKMLIYTVLVHHIPFTKMRSEKFKAILGIWTAKNLYRFIRKQVFSIQYSDSQL